MQAPSSTETARLARATFDHLKELGSFVVRNGTFEAALRFTARGVELNSEGRCPSLLSDGRCGIYEKRPATCAALPFEYTLPSRELPVKVESMKQAARSRGFECSFSEDAPVIWEGGDLTAGIYKDGYDQGVENSKSDADVQAFLGSQLFGRGEEGQQLLAAAIDVITSGRVFPFDFPTILEALQIAEGAGAPMPFPLPDFSIVAEKQLQLIRGAISQNLSRKQRADRDKTTYLRHLEAAWMDMMEE